MTAETSRFLTSASLEVVAVRHPRRAVAVMALWACAVPGGAADINLFMATYVEKRGGMDL